VLADQRRDQIIDHAGRLFVERGTIDVSMDEIAVAAGVARSTLYVYFTSRAALLAGCIRSMEADLEARLGVVQAGAPVAQLELLFHALLATVEVQPALFQLLLAANGSAHDIGQVVTEELMGIAGSVSSRIEAILRAGARQARWQVADPAQTTRLIGQLLYGSLAMRSLGLGTGSCREEAAALCSLVLDGVGPATSR
jgi:AcrR family transcriptional regulator